MTLPYMKFWFGDYLKDTMHLGTLEHGAYMLLLMHCWGNGKAMLKHCPSITRLMPNQWQEIKDDILDFFETDGEAIWSKRILEERENAEKDMNSASERGKKGAEARWNKKNASEKNNQAMLEHNQSNAKAMPEQSSSNGNHSHSHSHTLKEINSLSEREGALAKNPEVPTFEQFKGYAECHCRAVLPQVQESEFYDIVGSAYAIAEARGWKDTQGKSFASTWKSKIPFMLKDENRDRERLTQKKTAQETHAEKMEALAGRVLNGMLERGEIDAIPAGI